MVLAGLHMMQLMLHVMWLGLIEVEPELLVMQ